MPKLKRHSIDWDPVVREDGPKIYRYFRARFEHQQACDLVQDVLLRLFRKEEDGSYDPSQGSYTAYALGIAHFVAKEARRKTARLREDMVGEQASWDSVTRSADALPLNRLSACIEETAMQRQQTAALREAIRNLPENEQEVIALLVERDLSIQEIAVIVGKPTNTVKSHIHRAKTRLKDALQARPVSMRPSQGKVKPDERL